MLNGFVGAMVGGFELAGRLVMGVRAVVKAAVGKRAAEPSGAVSRSAPVWRRWRAALPPHRLPIIRRRPISITHPATYRWPTRLRRLAVKPPWGRSRTRHCACCAGRYLLRPLSEFVAPHKNQPSRTSNGYRNAFWFIRNFAETRRATVKTNGRARWSELT